MTESETTNRKGVLKDEVKPCPFCGGKSIVKWVKMNVGFRHWITCTVCHVKTAMKRDAPIDQWNTRYAG